MRLAVTIVLTTFLFGGAAQAGHGSGKQKKAKPARKTGVKFVVDQVNKDGQVVERLVVEGPLGKTRGKQRKGRELTLEEDFKAASKGKAVEEVDAEMPGGDLTLKGRLASAGSVTSAHNGSTMTRTRLKRTGSGFDPVAVETRVHRAGKVRRIRNAGKVIEEPMMLGKGEPVSLVGSISVSNGDGWQEMSGVGLSYVAHQPTTITLLSGVAIPFSRDIIAQAMRTGKAGTRDTRLLNDGENLTITVLEGVGAGTAYQMPTAHMAAFLRDTYRSVPRADEARWDGALDAELENLVNEGE